MMNQSATHPSPASGARPRPRRLAALALLLAALAAPALADPGDSPRGPDLTDTPKLEVPAGNRLAFRLYAQGVQIYRWNGSSWVFQGPEAALFADPEGFGLVGTHYSGPTWESASGSKVVGAVLERCTPDPSAIPWLLLKAVASTGPGGFHRVTFIQRVNTTGGLAPSGPGTSVGEVERVPYTAEYYFYRAQR